MLAIKQSGYKEINPSNDCIFKKNKETNGLSIKNNSTLQKKILHNIFGLITFWMQEILNFVFGDL